MRRVTSRGHLPRFLIIGAMKAGTTTLYRDMLASMPDIYLPADKEPEALTDDAVLRPAGRGTYAALFARARPGQLCGEASTAYTKRPDYEAVAERARRVLGPEVRLIYLMRHPITRIESQMRHEMALGEQIGDPNVAVRQTPRFLAYSQYAYQLDPWLNRFGRNALLALSFEDYIADRVGTLEQVAAFLGVRFLAEGIRAERAYNETEAKPVVTARWEPIYSSDLYRRVLRPWLGAGTRERLRRLLLPKANVERVHFDASTRQFLVDQLLPDQGTLRQVLGAGAPHWDLEPSDA